MFGILRVLRLHSNCREAVRHLRKSLSSVAHPKQDYNVDPKEEGKMSAWQIHSYGGMEELQLSKSVKIPLLMNPNAVLVKVMASSVNPIDVAMLGGYGNVLLNLIRQAESASLEPQVEFPLILGRDFAGEVVAKGNNVSTELMVGDTVFGVIPPHHQGCHAEYVVADKHHLQRKPNNIGILEAGCILYTGLTAWAALKVTGGLFVLPSKGKRMLVLGASGGVGTVAVQLLKAWEAEVVATCSTDAIPLVQSLGADSVIDYTDPEAMNKIRSAGKYDIILDAAGLKENEFHPYVTCLKDWSFAKYITLKSPLLRNTDSLGMWNGMVRNVADLVMPNLSTGAVTRGSSVRWGYFMPISAGVKEIASLIEKKKLSSVVNSTFEFAHLPEAYKKVMAGHLRGKVVVTMQ